MHRRRLAVAGVLALGVTLTLSGCIPALPFVGSDTPAQPTSAPGEPDGNETSDPIDADTANDIMWEAMPAVPEGFESWDDDGLPWDTFGSGWASVDYDDARLALVSRGIESPGWDDFSEGPAFRILVDIVLMDSADIAEQAMEELADAAAKPYELSDGDARYEYSPVAAPSGVWAPGTVEQNRSVVWTVANTTYGWTVYSRYDNIIVTAAGDAYPGGVDALADRTATFVSELREKLEKLPAQLDDAR